MKRLLITGGCGFIGSRFVCAWLDRNPEDTIVNVDCLTYAGSLDNLLGAAQNPRHRHVCADVSDPVALSAIWPEPFDLVVHFAAETHVDRSLEDPSQFVRTNVMGTQVLLSVAHERGAGAVVVISSDEVYGPTPKGAVFGVGEPLRPTSPYAASKAAADWMALAYARTFDMDVTIIRSVNVFGPYQYPEKLIPLFINKALQSEPLPLYGHGRQHRSWLYVDDCVDGILAIASDPEKRREKPVWHLGGQSELENRAIAEEICRACGAPSSLIAHVPDRPGHDARYALDDSHTRRVFQWTPRVPFAEGLLRTVDWIRAHREWCHQRLGWAPRFLRNS